MRTIKVKFVDFWTNDLEYHILVKSLRKHYDLEYSDDPDYVFCSCMSNNHIYTSPKAIKIFYTGENVVPDFNLCDYGIGFEWIDFDDRYLRLPIYYNTGLYEKPTRLMAEKHHIADDREFLASKSEFCSFVCSNGANPLRADFVTKLSETYKQVNCGGKVLNNVGGRVPNKLEFEKNHKFTVSFENYSHRGYTTEKIVEGFAAQAVPIYWGDPQIAKMFNPKAFINVMDYPSWEDVIERIKELDNNDEEYLSMIKEPALLNPEEYNFDTQFHHLEEFLCHIIDMPLEEAYRYPREGYGQFPLWTLKDGDYYTKRWKMWRYHPIKSILNTIKSKLRLL